MAISKDRSGRHYAAIDLLKQDTLTFDEKHFVLENYHPGISARKDAAFFTPTGLAYDLASMAVNANSKFVPKYVDVASGIGRLARSIIDFQTVGTPYKVDMTCIESNPEFVEVGKKVVPEANWICADAFDPETWAPIIENGIDCVVSNPPFLKIKHDMRDFLGYKQTEAELITMGIAAKYAKYGGLLLVQTKHVDFDYSGVQQFKRHKNVSGGLARFFMGHKDVSLSPCSIDASHYKDDWEGAAPLIELVNVGDEGNERGVVSRTQVDDSGNLYREFPERRQGI